MLGDANFSPLEMLIAASIIAATLVIPWWISAAASAVLVAVAAYQIKNGSGL